ncbi:hypothetical protein C8258_00930 [Nocardia sp. MDA0666]|nr:hypothetical protein C8258_00930 [Nocardia sp. MDA0666]
MSRRIGLAVATAVTTLTLGAAAPAIASAAAPAAAPPATSDTAAQGTQIQWLSVCLNLPLGSASVSFCV